MRVLFAATEAAPWVKVGGLGDFVGALPRVLRALGVDARIVLPAHAGVLELARPLAPVARFSIGHTGGPMRAEVVRSELDGVPIYLVSGPPIVADGVVYTGRMEEEGRRFTFFALACVELCRRLDDFCPDVLHLHDWHTAVAAHALAERRFTDPALAPIASLLTIHNLPYSGNGAQAELHAFGIRGGGDPRVPHEQREVPLVLGLLAADHLSTVSPTYAAEMLEPEHGCGLEGLLRSRRAELTGIHNGLDIERWDPTADPSIAAPFGPDDLDGRAECRAALLDELALSPASEAPIVGLVSRLVGQKGVDLAIDALRRLADRPFHAVLLGTGDPALERAALGLAASMPDRVRAHVAFDEGLSRRIVAGADVVLVPSRYEPCGTTQMIAMRYGAIPVARETGGLADTVRDLDLSDRPTGVLFPDATASSLAFALRRAFAARQRRASWDALARAGMREDFSWNRAARDYVALYDRLRAERGAHEE